MARAFYPMHFVSLHKSTRGYTPRIYMRENGETTATNRHYAYTYSDQEAARIAARKWARFVHFEYFDDPGVVTNAT